MSYLPYSADTVSGWVLAAGTSLLAHGAVVVLGYSGIVQRTAMPAEPEARPEYTITLERLDSDTLAGLLERQSPTAEAEADPDAPAAESETLALPEPEPEPDSEPEPETAAIPAPPEPETLTPEPLDAAPLTPETPDAPESDIAEPVTPDTDIAEPVSPEPVTPEPVIAETITPDPVPADPVPTDSVTAETITPETATALDPVVADDPAPVDTATAETLPTETVTAAPVDTPDPAPSNPLIAETLAPVSPIAADQTGFSAIPSRPVAQQPLAPQGATALPVAPAAQTPPTTMAEPVQRIITTAPLSTTGTAAPSAAPETLSALTTTTPAALPVIGRQTPRRAALPAAPPTAQDLAVGDLIARIRATPADPCLLALPRRDGDSGVGLELIAANDTAMAQFATALLTPADSAIRQTRTLVDPRQCAALAYLRDNRDYPATRLGIALDSAEVASGDEITGVLRGIAGRYVLLLIVDNNGVVQDLQRFMSFSGNFARFTVPVTRVGPQRDTSQSLIAITTDTPASTIRARDGQLAADVFRDLDAAQGRNAAIGFATFDVR